MTDPTDADRAKAWELLDRAQNMEPAVAYRAIAAALAAERAAAAQLRAKAEMWDEATALRDAIEPTVSMPLEFIADLRAKVAAADQLRARVEAVAEEMDGVARVTGGWINGSSFADSLRAAVTDTTGEMLRKSVPCDHPVLRRTEYDLVDVEPCPKCGEWTVIR